MLRLFIEELSMTFKKNWEKANENHQVPSDVIDEMVDLAFPGKTLFSSETISGGCANLNVKIKLQDKDQFFILRIYLRDKEAAQRELQLAKLLEYSVPVPKIYYVGDYKEYRFSVVEFMNGLTLRELLLSKKPHDVGSIMRQTGRTLAIISKHKFPKAGFFDRDLKVIENVSSESYLRFSKQCLNNQLVAKELGPDLSEKVNFYLDKYAHLFPDDSQKHLVHADFDPANILVDIRDKTWEITGVLDWEFSFSGSTLCDVANMLRYAHHMPPVFEKAFLEGLNEGGVKYEGSWRISVHLLNLLSLLDCLVRSDPTNKPKQCADICQLIIHIVQQLTSFEKN